MRFKDLMIRPADTVLAVLLVLGAFGAVSCSEGEPVATFEPETDPTKLFISLTLDHHAINLSTATSPTLQLTATPRNAFGEPMTGLPAPTFRSSDTTAVQVSADGLVTARREATGVSVIAEIVAPGNVRRTDMAMVNVTSSAPPGVASFSVAAMPPAGTIWPMAPLTFFGELIEIIIVGIPSRPTVASSALDAIGSEVPGLVVEYVSLDPAVATVDRFTGLVTTRRPGSVRVMAQTVAYGVPQTATATFTVTLPVVMEVPMHQTLDGALALWSTSNAASEFRIAPNGYVVWTNLVYDTVDVKFEEPANAAELPAPTCDPLSLVADFRCDTFILPPPTPNCGNSNCAAFPAIRQFPAPGVYRFSSRTRTGGKSVTGQIVVSNEGVSGP